MAQIDWSKTYNSEWYKKLMDEMYRSYWRSFVDFGKIEERVAAAYYPSAGEHTWGERKSPSGIFKYYGTSTGHWSSRGHGITSKELENLPRSPYAGTMKENMIQGLKADWIIFDEYSNLGAKMPKLKPPKKDYNTVGVRFLAGHNLAKIYTYRIRKGAKVHLG